MTTPKEALTCRAGVSPSGRYSPGDNTLVACGQPVEWVEGCRHRHCTIKHLPRLYHVNRALDEDHEARQ